MLTSKLNLWLKSCVILASSFLAILGNWPDDPSSKINELLLFPCDYLILALVCGLRFDMRMPLSSMLNRYR